MGKVIYRGMKKIQRKYESIRRYNYAICVKFRVRREEIRIKRTKNMKVNTGPVERKKSVQIIDVVSQYSEL